MAEPSKENAKKVTEIFLERFNEEHKTKFRWKRDSYLATKGLYYDVVAFDGTKSLKIQLTLAIADPDRELIRPKKADRVMIPLCEILKKNPHIPNIHVYANFHNPPTTKEETKEALFWMEYFISQKVYLNSLNYYSYDAGFDSQFVPKISKYISQLIISPMETKDGSKDVTWGFSWDKETPEPWISDDQRIMGAIAKKIGRCKDAILVVVTQAFPVIDQDIERLRELVNDLDLNEVWLVEYFMSPGSKAVRIK